VTAQQAKEILMAYRPWAADADDSEVAAALALCRGDAELAKWLAEHGARQSALRDRFTAIPVPEGLRQQILSEFKSRVPLPWWRRPVSVAILACLVIVIAGVSIWTTVTPPRGEDLSFNGYRNRMVRTALRAYGMDLETNDVGQIRAYLAQNQAPADYVLPRGLEQTPTVGCGVLSWQNKRVAMVCFRTGKPLEPGAKSDLFLFVIDKNNLGPQSPSQALEFAGVSELVTASWSAGEKIYLLAAYDEAELRKRL
jgi:hypothetical protein